MGSKAPIVRKPSQGEAPEERLLGRSDLLKAPAKNELLGRIADALQVPPAVLYNSPTAITPARTANIDGSTDNNLDQNCEALLHAYRRIRDPEMRHRLLTLVQEAAEQI
jgi:hypothetical protein